MQSGRSDLLPIRRRWRRPAANPEIYEEIQNKVKTLQDQLTKIQQEKEKNSSCCCNCGENADDIKKNSNFVVF